MIIRIIAIYRLILSSNSFRAVTPRIIHTTVPIGIRVVNEYLNPSLRHDFDIIHCKIISIAMIVDVTILVMRYYLLDYSYIFDI